MIDITQIALAVTIIVLTVIFSIVGIQIYHLIKELRLSVEKINKILDDSSQISAISAKQITSLSQTLDTVKNGLSIINFFKGRKHE